VTAPSANPPGAEPPRALDAARAYFGDAVDVYLDGGTLAGGASTVAALDGDRVRILRAGPLREEQLQAALEDASWRS
jgi:tRNA A37 threonylcarbamoyladenosine synthetase subunit TsaC/SUA5/YrdC